MNKAFENWFGDSKEAKRLYAQESLIINTSEDFLALMESQFVKKSKLASMMDKTKSFVSQSLNGKRNLTLRTLADMAFFLDATVIISFKLNNKTNNIDDNISQVITTLTPRQNNIFKISEAKNYDYNQKKCGYREEFAVA